MNKEIEIAVKWWGDQLRAPMVKFDNGDDSLHGFMGQELAALNKKAAPIIPEARIQLFELSLTAILKDICDEYPNKSGGHFRKLSNDYGPDSKLSLACKASEIKCTITTFPWKTTMWINPGSVSVSEGYGAETQIIYESI